MENNKRTFVYETRDTTFGSYTLRFKERGEGVLNMRALATLQELSDKKDLGNYSIYATDGSFKAIPNFDISKAESIEIKEVFEEDPEMWPKEPEFFTRLLDELDTPMKEGYFYNKSSQKGVLLFNGTTITMFYQYDYWHLVWKDHNDYSLGILKECLEELQKHIDLGEFYLDWEFDKKTNDCYVFFTK